MIFQIKVGEPSALYDSSTLRRDSWAMVVWVNRHNLQSSFNKERKRRKNTIKSINFWSNIQIFPVYSNLVVCITIANNQVVISKIVDFCEKKVIFWHSIIETKHWIPSKCD